MNQPLSVSHINQSAPYEVNSEDGDSLYFITDSGLLIEVAFAVDDMLIQQVPCYQVSVLNRKTLVQNRKSPRDLKLRDTIVAILQEFFRANTDALLYICETGDGKQSMRNRLFDYWYRQAAANSNIVKTDAQILDAEGQVNYCSLFIRSDSPYCEAAIKEFNATALLLSQKPSSGA